MAENEIERMVVVLEAEYTKLLNDVKTGVNQAEKEFDKLSQAPRKTETALEKVRGALDKIKDSRAFDVLKTAAIGATGAVTALAGAIVLAFNQAQEAIGGLRIQKSFQVLAARSGQSGDEILKAMTKASRGTIAEFQLMEAAASALNFKIAKTPEEFERLTEAAIKLGRIRGLSPGESLNRFVFGIGKREIELLDELGITTKVINAELEKLAQRDFGKTNDQLSALERDMLFAEAAINAAQKSADNLGDSLEDSGNRIEAFSAKSGQLKQALGEGFIIVFDKAFEVVEGMKNTLVGPDGFFPVVEEGGKLIQTVFAGIVATFFATAGSIAQQVVDLKKVFTGELSIGEFLSSERVITDFQGKWTDAFEKLKTDYAEIFDPASLAEGIEPVKIPAVIEPTVDSAAADKLASLSTEFIDLQQETAEKQEKLESDHTERMLEIDEKYGEDKLKLEQERADALTELDKDVAKQREEINDQARDDLAQLERDTDEQIATERDRFNEQERRQTEDHLRDMQGLFDSYLFDLQDAVTARDARAIVDLRRRFQKESRERETDFRTQQRRQRDDLDKRVDEIRENERAQRDEIEASQQEQLDALAASEAEKRDQINKSYDEQFATLQANYEKQKNTEIENYNERKAALDEALQKRLEAVAKELADEKDIDEKGAQAILETLNKTFGIGGDIDALMEDFVQRRKQKMTIQIAFEQQVSGDSSKPPKSKPPTAGAGQGQGSHPGAIPGFQFGGIVPGAMNEPRLIMAHGGEEIVPVNEVARLNQMQQAMASGGGGAMRLVVEHRGSAPPGIRAPELDAMAEMMVRAFREAGINAKK